MTSPLTTLQNIAFGRTTQVWLWAAVCVGMLSFGTVAQAQPKPVGAQSVELASARERHEELQDRLVSLRDKRTGLESRYTKLTAKIAEQKRQGASGQLIGGLQLESALQQGRELANQLNGLQEQIREVESALEYSRQEILAVYQTSIGTLERALLTSNDGEARKAAIDKINALKRERHGYTLRQGATPDLDLGALPSLDAAPNDPEELQAMAAELDDTERKLRGHIGELEQQIERLERDRRLRQRAADFADEESFFDESVRDRRVARSNPRVIGPVGDSAGSGKGGAAPAQPSDEAAPTSGNGAEAPSGDQGSFGGAAEGDTDGAMTDDSNGAPNTADPGVGGDRGTDSVVGGGGPVAAGIGTPSDLPGVGLPSDPFATPGVVVRTDVETNGPTGGIAGVGGGGTLEGQMRSLKDKKKQLEQKATELRLRSKELKKRANEL